jgi:hypothetical protein
MRFQKALDDAIAKMRKAALDRRTALRRVAYKYSPDKTLSRLYAYRLVPRTRTDGMRSEVVPEEAAVVREVIRGFAEGLTVETIKAKLDAKGVRNRSGKPFSRGELLGLAVRSVFCGRVKGPLGTLVRSRVYEPIVSRREWALAAQNASKAAQNEDFEFAWDTRSDAYQPILLE